MAIQNYLIVENNIVTNNVVWDGNTQTWQPPVDSVQLVQATTPAMIWDPILVDDKITGWVLSEHIGYGTIGFTWDGTILMTNQPEPPTPTTLTV